MDWSTVMYSVTTTLPQGRLRMYIYSLC